MVGKTNNMWETIKKTGYKFDYYAISMFDKFGLTFLRLSLGFIFIWFGILKPFGLSPAQELVSATVYWSTPEIIVPLLGMWEVAIGVCLLFTPLIRVGLALLALQLPGTFLPLVLLPEVTFTVFPFGLTLEGQYIIKNLVVIGAALVVAAKIPPLQQKL